MSGYRNSKYPDRSGFHFNLSPANDVYGNSRFNQEREQFYGAKFIEIDDSDGFKGWTNWSYKYEPDPRFLAISDENAECHAFPEVDSPWHFTTYIFKGVVDRKPVIEPPLYSPKTLEIINGVCNRDGYENDESLRFVGKVSVEKSWQYEKLYYYQGSSGKIYKQEDLENTTGKIKEPWVDPEADISKGQDPRKFKRLKQYGVRKVFQYKEPNTGITLYRKDLLVKSTKWGEHGNIPPRTLNMSASRDWFNPENMLQTKIIPKIVVTKGTPLYATIDGIIDYNYVYWGVSRSKIYPIKNFVSITPSGVIPERWKVEYDSNNGVLQPLPNMPPASLQKLKSVATSYSDYDLVHKGCYYFRGNKDSCGCDLYSELNPGDPQPKPDPGKCILYPDDNSNPNDYYHSKGGQCPYYSAMGPRKIQLYESTASTTSELMEIFAGIDNYDEAGGRMKYRNCKAVRSLHGSSLGGGTLEWCLTAFFGFPTQPTLLPRQMNDTELRWDIEYEVVKLNPKKREIIGKANSAGVDKRTFKRGTGVFAFDTKDTSFKGVDSQFYEDFNLMSYHRLCASSMPCYKADKCNKAYGKTHMIQGLEEGKYSDIDGEEYCRYYNYGCPNTEIPRRAREYDYNYTILLDRVAKPFIESNYDLTIFPLYEYKMGNGVYGAYGNNKNIIKGITIIEDYPQSGKYLYFIYSKDENTGKIKEVYGFITHYDGDNNLCTLPSDTDLPSNWPLSADETPWLVKLDINYRSPVKYLTYITNYRAFIGGRHPEYKDYSKRGREILCTMGAGGSIYGIEGGDTGRGGDPAHTAEDYKGYYRGYWVDKTGEYITDGRSLGDKYNDNGEEKWNCPPAQCRTMKSPQIVNGATPIEGVVGDTIISPDMTISADIRRGWLYSNDTRDFLNTSEIQNLTNSTGRKCPPMIPDRLPTEREYGICPSCSKDHGDGLNKWAEPIIDVIFTDDEMNNIQSCPRCGTKIEKVGKWTHFPEVYAKGVVSVWGLPGQEIDAAGYYWRNPTLISRIFITEILNKLGDFHSKGGGYELDKDKSANKDKEGNVNRLPVVYTNNIWTEDKKNKYRNDDYTTEGGKRLLDNNEYKDNTVLLSFNDEGGSDLFSIKHIKNLRNRTALLLGFKLGNNSSVDFYIRQQGGTINRYQDERLREYYLQYKGLETQIIAANSRGLDQYTQFWDGTLIPGKIIYYYYPTGPTWWRKSWLIGGISRHGGTEWIHLDNSTALGTGHEGSYTGDELYSRAFIFLQGWLPLDKEIVKAYIVTRPVKHPDVPPLGTVWSGRKVLFHYHAMTDVKNDDHGAIRSDEVVDIQAQETIIGYDSAISYDYKPYTYDRDTPYLVNDEVIKKFIDYSYGFGDYSNNNFYPYSQEFIKWDGFGENIFQIKTEPEIWKSTTFDEFKDFVRRNKIITKFVAGDGNNSSKTEVEVDLFSKYFLGEIDNKLQPIEDYFDLSGLNQALLYPKAGPVIEDKIGDTSWAEEGEVVIQADSSQLQGAENYSDGGYGQASAGWKPLVVDVTGTVKERYNKRIERIYIVNFGMSISELWEETQKRYCFNNLDSNYYDDLYPPDENVNYRYLNDDVKGMWLNDPWHYPKLEGGEFPQLAQSGDEYDFDSDGRISEVSSWYIPEGAEDESHPDHYKYHPKQVIQSDTTDFTKIYEKQAKPYPNGYWISYSDVYTEQYFICDLRAFPVEKVRKPFRFKKGRWNMANAVCPNLKCPIGGRHMSVSDYIQFRKTQPFGTTIPSIYGTKCAACGTLINKTEYGAIYENGDGITTVSYSNLPTHGCYITGIELGDSVEEIKHDIYIDYKHPESDHWEILYTIKYLPNKDKFQFTEYQQDGTILIKEEDEYPKILYSKFSGKDIYHFNDSAYEGCVYAEKIRYRVKPMEYPVHMNMNGAPLQSSYYTDHTFKSGDTYKRNYWQNGYLVFSNDFSDPNSDRIRFNISSNTDGTIYTKDKIENSAGFTKWRLEKTKYIATCSKFIVYGIIELEGDISKFSYPEVFLSPINPGINSISLTNIPSCITRVMIGSNDLLEIELFESNENDVSKLYFIIDKAGEKDGKSYYRIVSGEYIYDVKNNIFYIPSKCKTEDGTYECNLWELNSNFEIDELQEDYLPAFIRIEYVIGLGAKVKCNLTALGTGPSYIVEKEAVCKFVDSNSELAKVIDESGETVDFLNNLTWGESVKINGKKYDMQYAVYNTERLKGNFKIGYIYGNELPAKGWTEGEISKLFGGMTQKWAGIGEKAPATKITGKATGEAYIYGPPKKVISGKIPVYAPKMIKREYIIDGKNKVVTYERTGGLLYTGMAFGPLSMLDGLKTNEKGRRGICYSPPELIVYLRERDLEEEITDY
ncbi:MAG: hypothetical protein ACP6IQ_02255 [Candidatus Njordarchaeia archaeon]